MADKIKEEHTSIEVLINNAGVFLSAKPRNAQGLDIRFVVNFLAPIVLTEGLLPTLKAGDQPRVINLSSAAQAPVSLNAVVGKEALGDQAAYAQSKLALTMWNTQMAKTNLDITFIAVNPGSLLNTKMVQEAYGKHWAPADKGADILVELATDPKHVRMSGKYFDNDNGNYAYASPDAYEQVKIDQLMETANVVIKQEL